MSFRVRPEELRALPCCCGCAGSPDLVWTRRHAPVGWNMALYALGQVTIHYRLEIPICRGCLRVARRASWIPWGLLVLLVGVVVLLGALPISDRAGAFALIGFMIVFLLLVPTAAALSEWALPVHVLEVHSDHSMTVEFADPAVAAIFRRSRDAAGR